MTWDVKYTSKARKQAKGLPERVQEVLDLLVAEIEQSGPVRSNWTSYGKLGGKKDCHHCHIKKGKPTYVAVWQVTDKKIKLVEVRYVGTHEGADYDRLC